jgi:hypothetical protein
MGPPLGRRLVGADTVTVFFSVGVLSDDVPFCLASISPFSTDLSRRSFPAVN